MMTTNRIRQQRTTQQATAQAQRRSSARSNTAHTPTPSRQSTVPRLLLWAEKAGTPSPGNGWVSAISIRCRVGTLILLLVRLLLVKRRGETAATAGVLDFG